MTLIRLRTARRAPRRGWPDCVAARHPGGALTGHAATPVQLPWRIGRDRFGRAATLTNLSGDTLRQVRLVVCGGTRLALTLPSTVPPGYTLRVWGDRTQLAGVLAAPDAMCVLRWIDARGRELLWPFPPE